MESLASMSDSDIKGLDTRSEVISPIAGITSYQSILEHFNASQKTIQQEHYNILYRVLKLSTYNGRMFALNEMISLLQNTKKAQNEFELNCNDVGEWAKDKILPGQHRTFDQSGFDILGLHNLNRPVPILKFEMLYSTSYWQYGIAISHFNQCHSSIFKRKSGKCRKMFGNIALFLKFNQILHKDSIVLTVSKCCFTIRSTCSSTSSACRKSCSS